MITVGLVKELYFIAKVFNESLTIDITPSLSSRVLKLKINAAGDMDVFYGDNHIWYEKVDDSLTSFFGVESCDTISRIMACIDNGSSWDHYVCKESLDKIASLA